MKVSKEDVVSALDTIDTNKDGFFSLGELIKAIRDGMKKSKQT